MTHNIGAQYSDISSGRTMDSRGRTMNFSNDTIRNDVDNFSSCNRSYIKRDRSVDNYLDNNRPKNNQYSWQTSPKPHQDKEDILFDKSSGVTRIPAQRQRRHSIQLGGTGYSAASPHIDNKNRSLREDNFLDRFRQEQIKKQTGPPVVNHSKYNFTDSIPDGYASDTEVLYSHLKYKQRPSDMGVPVTEKPRRPSLDLSGQDPNVRHGTAIFIRRPSISSLTLEKDSYIRDSDGRAFRKGDLSDNYDSCVSDTEGEDYIKRNIRVRRHSISTPSGSYAIRKAPPPRLLTDFQDWGGYRPAAVLPKLKFEDSDSDTGNVPGSKIIPVRRHSVTYAPCQDSSTDDVSPPQNKTYLATPGNVVTTSHGKRTRRRRCRPLSIVKEDISPVHVPDDDPDKALLNGFGTSQIASRAPLEDIIQLAPERATINPLTSSTGRRNSNTEINIQGENSNLNIRATGNVQISVNTSQPLAMAGATTNATNKRVDHFAAWTPGMSDNLPAAYSRNPQLLSSDQNACSPLGLWRQGNILVDSVSPVVHGNALHPGGGMYPWLPPNAYPVPVMVVPYPGGYNNNPTGHGYQPQAPSLPALAQNKSIYTPLSVDTGPSPPSVPALGPSIAGPTQQGLLKTRIPVQSAAQSQVRNNEQDPCIRDPEEMSDSFSNVDSNVQPETPEPVRDIKELIADFENKKTDTGIPEFGTTYKNPTKAEATEQKTEGGEMCCQTDPIITDGQERYDLNVEKTDGWSVTSPIREKEPTPLHAYIAEMSISEVRFDDQNNSK